MGHFNHPRKRNFSFELLLFYYFIMPKIDNFILISKIAFAWPQHFSNKQRVKK